AISRGARSTTFVERDFRLLGELEKHLRDFGIADQATIARSDVYRWIERWQAPNEAVTVFISPPFPDFEHRLDDPLSLTRQLQEKTHAGSVIVLQSEECEGLIGLPRREQWEERRYGRNRLWIWVKEEPAPENEAAESE